MKFDEILDVIRKLSMSQGFYGRLLRDIQSLDEDSLVEFKEVLEAQNFKEPLDVVFYFEC